MKNIKNLILRFLSGLEILTRGFSKYETPGEPINFPIPGQPRIMSTYGGNEPRDFNAWAQHVHHEIQKKYM